MPDVIGAFLIDLVAEHGFLYVIIAVNRKHPSYKTFGHRRSLRLSNFDYQQPYVYHIILGTYRRKSVLSREALTDDLIELLVGEAKNMGIRIYAYCFMPDHVHLLLTPESKNNPVAFVQRYKSRSTRIYWRHGGVGKLWQRGFYDHILRREEDVQQLARYILENPVRKGLTDDYLFYPFSGSLVFDKKEL